MADAPNAIVILPIYITYTCPTSMSTDDIIITNAVDLSSITSTVNVLNPQMITLSSFSTTYPSCFLYKDYGVYNTNGVNTNASRFPGFDENTS